MSNFTDQSVLPYLTQHTPYIEQFPLQESLAVGRQKQQQYDAGVQRIQGEIDKVAGLDIARDVDRNYLQSKLNTLQGDLKKVAAGDFSNYQLTNSVGGMIGSIAKDRTVQNAVGNTIKYRNELSIGEDLREKGKLSPNREFDFQRSVDTWLTDPSVGASFNGKYKEHIDVNKKVIDVIKGLHPNASNIDIPYTLNADGSVNTGMIAAAMQRQGVKEVTEGQIRTAVNSVLDTNDLDELASQGRYNYRGMSPIALNAVLQQTYNSTRADYQESLDKLKKQALTATDPAQQIEINQSIDYYNSLLGDPSKGIPSQLEMNYLSNLKNVSTDPDGVRSDLFIKNYLDQISNGFKYREVSNTLVNNPLEENRWKEREYNLNILKYNADQYWEGKKMGLAERKLALDEREEAAKTKLTQGPDLHFTPFGDQTISDINNMKSWMDHNTSLVQKNKAIVNELATKLSSTSQKLSEEDIKKRLDEYSKNNYTPPNSAIADMFNTYLDNSTLLSQMDDIYKNKEKEAIDEYQRKTGSFITPLRRDLENIQDLNIQTPQGEISFSPEEVYDLIYRENKKTVGGGVATRTQVSVDESNLSPRQIALKNLISQRYATNLSGGITGNSKIDSYISNLENIKKERGEVQSNIDKEIAHKLAPLTGVFASEITGIQYEKEIDKKNLINAVTGVVDADVNTKTATDRYNPSETLNILKGDDTELNFLRQGDRNFIVVTDTKGGTDAQFVEVEPGFVAKVSSLGVKFMNQNINVAQTLLTNGGETTNSFKDYDHSYYKTHKFGGYLPSGKRSVTLPVSADLEKVGEQVFVTFKLNTSNLGLLTYQWPYPVNVTDFENKDLPSMTDDKLAKLFSSTLPKGTEIQINGK